MASFSSSMCLEYRGDVGDPEPVDADVPDVRLVVQADVAGVAADRAGPQFLLGSQPFLQPFPDRGRPGTGVVAAADRLADPGRVGQRPGFPNMASAMASAIRIAVSVSPGSAMASSSRPGPYPARLRPGWRTRRGAAGCAASRRHAAAVRAGNATPVGGVPGAVAAPQPGAFAAEPLAGAVAAALLVSGSVTHQAPPLSRGIVAAASRPPGGCARQRVGSYGKVSRHRHGRCRCWAHAAAAAGAAAPNVRRGIRWPGASTLGWLRAVKPPHLPLPRSGRASAWPPAPSGGYMRPRTAKCDSLLLPRPYLRSTTRCQRLRRAPAPTCPAEQTGQSAVRRSMPMLAYAP